MGNAIVRKRLYQRGKAGQNRIEAGLSSRLLLLKEDVGSKADDRWCAIYLMSPQTIQKYGWPAPNKGLGLKWRSVARALSRWSS